jgi:hypothetical protein
MGKHTEREIQLDRGTDSISLALRQARWTGDEVGVEVTYYRMLRNGNSEEVTIRADLTPEDLTCVRRTALAGIRMATQKMQERIAWLEDPVNHDGS